MSKIKLDAHNPRFTELDDVDWVVNNRLLDGVILRSVKMLDGSIVVQQLDPQGAKTVLLRTRDKLECDDLIRRFVRLDVLKKLLISKATPEAKDRAVIDHLNHDWSDNFDQLRGELGFSEGQFWLEKIDGVTFYRVSL